jgi:hypothetical protein
VVVPVTFMISYVIWWWVLSNQILLSVSRPSPLGLVMTIISPLSATCSLQFAACLYTSCLFVYSVCDNDILHLIVPLCPNSLVQLSSGCFGRTLEDQT